MPRDAIARPAREAKPGEPLEENGQRHWQLEPRERGAEAKVNAGAEGAMGHGE